uniref:LTD domain-containing protein n=1 Tax=Steinernema glaseri TaxID=37863 RepID=A0A1I7Y7Z6_9BILA
MRADFDARIAQNRREIDELYKSKLAEANETASRGRSSAGEAREEAARARLRIHELETSMSTHNKKVDELNRKINDLESALQRSRDEMNIKVSQRDEQIVDLEREIGRMISEYRDLMDLKVQLDVELQAYQKLLEGEESRLHMSPTSSPNVSQEMGSGDASVLVESGNRGVKRKRYSNVSGDYSYDHTTKRYRCSAFADGDIAIDEVDTDGRHVRLKNKGEEDVSIGGWRVKSIGGGQEVVYKFHPRQMLKAGETITIWSKDSGEKHEPPHSLVMKNQLWPTGDDLRTGIQDTEGKTVAGMENVLEFGSRTIDNGTDPDQRCSIM